MVLPKSQSEVDELISSIPGIIWQKWLEPDEEQGRKDFLSRYTYQMLGYGEEEWLSHRDFWLRILHPADRRRALRELEAVLRGGKGGVVQFRWIAKGGRVIWVEACCQVVLDRRGRPIGMRGVNIDITARKEAEAALREAIRTREEMLALVSHDLRNPLSVIKMNSVMTARAVAGKEDCEPVLRSAELMRRAADQMDRLVGDLLDASRLEAGQLTVEPEKTEAGGILREALELLEPAASERRVTFEVRPPEAEPTLLCDSHRLCQVLCNLVGNAIKFSPTDSVVSIEVVELRSTVLFRVIDRGAGIPEDLRPLVFERYWQRGNRPGHGTGLGLYIAKGIVEAHGGSIWVDSRPEGGSIFSFTLPRYGAPAADVVPEESCLAATS
ncbi:MAG: PAS domain-containing sensor histidine kinase [Oligoflexia bacterium]|nr:PAS domain-containing sensor histidine kinase [Oligoflexia bacterium]